MTQNRNGFSLVEALVALAVLSVALTPLFAQVNAAFRVSRAIEENLVASGLAQEGIELVRGMRDDNWFAGSPVPMGDLFDDCTGGCQVQFNDTFPQLTGDVPLKRDDYGRYRYDQGTDTPFHRTITVEAESATHLIVTSEVAWTSNADHSVVVTEHLFDWLEPGP
ncbi:MAG TPA: prepilin-type N-terminal cleavage/methylation domain-containing protein [Candidatus Paceibacterota bacterium]|nr:prepilin-type N-terminal cleavage/methylation domain-containing protein [Candidatus Paceibacterota bacterium]